MTKIFLDTADIAVIWKHSTDPRVEGFTTNPSILAAQGVSNYEQWIRAASDCTDKPISVEVTTDDITEMEDQAYKLHELNSQLYVKIPITTTDGKPTNELIWRLSQEMKTNVTAVMTTDQVRSLVPDEITHSARPYIISVFAGRIADTGRDPVTAIDDALTVAYGSSYILWASSREIYNYYQARQIGCDIITLTPELYAKLALDNKDLDDYSLETVKMFDQAARSAGLTL